MNEHIEKKDILLDLLLILNLKLRMLISNLHLIIIFSLLGVGISYILYTNTDQRYKATITFVTEVGNNDKLGSYSSIAAQFGIDLGGNSSSIFEGENVIEFLKSKKIVEATLTSMSLNNKSLITEYLNNHKIAIKGRKIEFEDSKDIRFRDSLLDLVYRRIVNNQLAVYRKDKKNSIISMDMIDENENFAKEFIQILCNSAITEYTNYKTKKSNANLSILQKQADSLNSIITGKIYGVAMITDININPTRQISRVPIQRNNIDLNVSSAVYTEVLKQLEIAKIASRKETPLIQIIDSSKYPLEKLKKGKLFYLVIGFVVGAFLTIIFLLLKDTLATIKKESAN